MRVFVAGATGAIGARLVPQLVERGHEVIGTARSPEKADRLRAQGAEPVVLDLLDAGAVAGAVAAARPDAIVHQATALAGFTDFKHFDRELRDDEPAPDRGDGPAPRRRARGRRRPLRRAELRGLAVRPRRRAGQDRGRSARPDAGRRRCARRSPRSGTSRTQSSPPAGSRSATARFYGVARRPAARARPQAALPDRRRRRRHLVVRPSRRRGGRDRARARARHARASTTSSTTSRRRRASGCPRSRETIGAKPPRRVPRWLARLIAGEAGIVLMTEARGPRTRRRSGSSAGRCATRAGARGSKRPTGRPRQPRSSAPRRGFAHKKVLPPTVPESTSGGRTFAEPISLSSTDPADFRLPATAFAIGFDLVASRTRRRQDTKGQRPGVARPSVHELVAISVTPFPGRFEPSWLESQAVSAPRLLPRRLHASREESFLRSEVWRPFDFARARESHVRAERVNARVDEPVGATSA